jgi:hypothetical protein
MEEVLLAFSSAALPFCWAMSLAATYLATSLACDVCRVGGSIPVVWTYFAEFQPANRRGGALSFLATFWMVSSRIFQ